MKPLRDYVRPRLHRPEGVPSDAILRVLRVAPEHSGMRVDVFVQARLRNTSRTRAKAIVEHSAYSMDGRPLKPHERVRAEDHVALWRPQFELEVEAANIDVLYEDEHLLAVNKPPLMAVHPTARYHRYTVIKQLQAQRPTEHLSLLHRLDRETSGLLLLARSAEADRAFKRMIEDRSLESAGQRTLSGQPAAALRKNYLAITQGVPNLDRINSPLEADGENPLRVKMRIAMPGCGLRASTGVQVVDQKAGYALVSCELFTGRQHQIRVHLASIGCPLVGDKLYGPDDRLLARAADGSLSDEDLLRLELPRHALHASRFCLPHAMTGAALELEAPPPEDMMAFWDGLPTAEVVDDS